MLTSLEPLPLGPLLDSWSPPAWPQSELLSGYWCQLEPLNAGHAEQLWLAQAADQQARLWTYLPYGPFESEQHYRDWLGRMSQMTDPQFYAVRDRQSGRVSGVVSYLRIEPLHGVLELGHLYFAPELQRTTAATEALFLLIDRAITLGYRRIEWKCNSLNWPSRRAAQRLGFSYEGLFRQAMVVKGRSRDSCWYSILDSDWLRLRPRFEQWLEPANFVNSQQQQSLSSLTQDLLVNLDPGLA